MTGADRVTAALRIHLLGGFSVVGPAGRIEDAAWRLRKARALIKLLALAPDHRLHREQALDILWPTLEPEAAGNNLRQALHAARRALCLGGPLEGDSPAVVLRGPFVALDPRPWVDAVAFETAAAAALARRDPIAVERAVRMYVGDLLPEDRYEDWTLDRREALRRTYAELLVTLAGSHAERGELDQAAAALERVLEVEPAHEDAHVLLMRLHALRGRRRDALAQFRLLEEALRRELDAVPGEAARRAFEDLRAGRLPGAHAPPAAGRERSAAPRPASRRGRPAHDEGRRQRARRPWLPGVVTTFVGREHELESLRALVRCHRLVTLIGPAGCGKTRLALELARRITDVPPEAVWFADLAMLQDQGLLAQAVAAVVGLRGQPADPLASLADLISERPALLVLDNCEHLRAACARLAASLLDACPHLRIVATSRARLVAPGEELYPVPPLAVPPAGALVQEIHQAEAVRLFAERARAVRPGFEVTLTSAPAVAEIARRLDGLPLAIELAAARIRHLSVDQVLARLDDRFRFLRGPRLGPPRHQTLEAAVAWSYDVLDPRERTLFHRLAAFAGSCTLEAVEAVCADAVLPAADVLEVLAELIDKSLVVVEERGDDVRYLMLETLKAYGRAQSAETETITRRLHAYLLGLAERSSGLPAQERPRWVEQMEAEHDNLRAALEYALATGETVGALRLAAALGPYWRACAPTEGRDWLARTLIATASQADDQRLRALLWMTELTMFLDDYAHAAPWADEAVGLAGTLGDRASHAVALVMSGHLWWHLGDTAGGAATCAQGLALKEHVGDPFARALLLYHAGRLAWHEADHDRVASLAAELLAVSKEVRDASGQIEALSLLGETARARRDYPGATARFREALAMARAAGDRFRAAALLSRLADVLRLLGEAGEARACYLGAIPTLHRMGEKWFLMRSFVGLARLDGAAAPVRAARLLGAAQALRDGFRVLPDQANFDRAVAGVRALLDAGRFDAAWAASRTMPLEAAVALALGSATDASLAGPSVARTR
jgi:predicted ATPase/DNA-binding SARP family transcriptional activator